jgi:hypothetical protein
MLTQLLTGENGTPKTLDFERQRHKNKSHNSLYYKELWLIPPKIP